MRKSVITIISIFLVSFIVFSMTAMANDPVEVSYWQQASHREFYDAIVEDFNDANPDINIEMSYFSTDGIKENLKVAASSNSLPTIWFNWGGSLGSFYPENGLAYDLTEFAAENNWNGKFVPATLELSSYNNGRLYGYPLTMNMLGLFYNKEVFDDCGLTPPETFGEFENILKVLKEEGYTPFALAGKFGWHVMRLNEALLEMYAGADLHDQLSGLEADWTDPAVVKAYEKFKEYIDKGYFLDGFISLDPDDMYNVLYSKRAAITIEGPWITQNITLADQSLDDYGYFKLTLNEKGNRISSFVEMAQFNANLTEEEVEAAVKFLDYCHSDEVIDKYALLMEFPICYQDG